MTSEEINKFLELAERFCTEDKDTLKTILTLQDIELFQKGMEDPGCLKAMDEKMTSELDQIDLYEESNKLSASFRKEALNRFTKKLAAENKNQQLQHEFKARRPNHFWNKTRVAAVIGTLLLISGLIFYQIRGVDRSQKLAVKNEIYRRTTPIVPGSSGAILTLGNGRKIPLGLGHKQLMHIGSLTISQTKEAAVFSNKLSADHKVLYNTLTTPRGKQFQVELPDGTKVWLNASSTLKFPTVFNRRHRTVELNGEAYFEVVHNEEHPFQVAVNGQLIQDIGTKFNIKAYSEDQVMMTSVVEGVVDQSNGIKKIRLTKGQQVSVKDQKMVVSKADFSQILAWKSGFFSFQNASVAEIMRQLSRWYNVDISYANNLRNSNGQHYTGRIDRNLDLQDLLDGLQFSQMHFSIDKNKRTILIEN